MAKISLFVGGDLAVQQELLSDPLQEITASEIWDYDYRLLNFEAPVIPNPVPKTLPKVGPTLYQQRGWEYFMGSNRFNTAVLANNHIMDYGIEGLNHTVAHLSRLKIPTVGAGLNIHEIYSPLILTANGIDVAVFAAGEATFGCATEKGQSGYAWLFHPTLIQQIREIRSRVHAIILIAHGGWEMVKIPLPEWRDAYRMFIDHGVDVVVGGHPHLIQGKETYKGKDIYYSLGNLFFNNHHIDQKEWSNSLGVGIEIEENRIKTTEYFFQASKDRLLLADQKMQQEEFENRTTFLTKTDEYYEEINQQCVAFWDQQFYKYFAFRPFKDKAHSTLPTWGQKMINAFRYLWHKNDYFVRQNEMLLIHNIRIETNRFLINRALTVKNQVY